MPNDIVYFQRIKGILDNQCSSLNQYMDEALMFADEICQAKRDREGYASPALHLVLTYVEASRLAELDGVTLPPIYVFPEEAHWMRTLLVGATDGAA